MTRILRAGGAFLALAGCLQSEASATLMPDGSGKLTIRLAIKQSMLKTLEEFAKQFGGEATDPVADFGDPLKLKENSEGFAAWGEAEKVADGEWLRLSITGYFDDINKARFYTVGQQFPEGEKEKTLYFAAKYEKAGAGGKLSRLNEMGEGVLRPGAPGADPNDKVRKAVLEWMKPLYEGMKIGVSLTIPGPVDDTGPFPDKKGRTASFTWDSKMFFEAMKDPNGETAKKLEALSNSAGKTNAITWAKATVTDDEVAAFKREMAAAKESWAKRLKEAEAKKAAESEKKDE